MKGITIQNLKWNEWTGLNQRYLGCIFLGGIFFFYADMQMKPFIMHRKGLRKPLNHFVLL